MKKLILPIVLLIFTVQLMAQKARVGFTAGANMSKFIFKEDIEENLMKSIEGFNVGLLTDIPLSEKISIQPAFNFIRKGFKISDFMTVHLNYIEVPVNFVYKIKNGSNEFFIGAGPYAAVGLYSTMNFIDENNFDIKRDVKFGSELTHDMRGLDIGANVMAGVVIKNRLIISGFYSRGIYNLTPVRVKGEAFYNQTFGIKLGWLTHSITGK